jgi:hypothetical protein
MLHRVRHRAERAEPAEDSAEIIEVFDYYRFVQRSAFGAANESDRCRCSDWDWLVAVRRACRAKSK